MRLSIAASIVGGLIFISAALAMGQPIVSVSPDSISTDLMAGSSIVKTVTIANTGTSNLDFGISFLTHKTAALARGNGISNQPRATRTSPQFDHKDAYSQFGSQGIETKFRPDKPEDAASGFDAYFESFSPLTSDSFVIYSDDMEHGINGWTHSSLHANGIDLWAQTTSRSRSGSYSWHVSQHSLEGDDAVRSPVIDLTRFKSATLSFYQWYSFDDCADIYFEADGGIVEISTNGGATWTKIYPIGGYPYILDDICYNPLAYQDVYSHRSGTGDNFVPATFDLTPFVGQEITVRFRAGWDCGNCASNEGWYVDDVSIYSEDYVSWLTVSPENGTVAPNSSVDLALTVDATSLFGGQYLADMLVTSNDPATPSLMVPTVTNVTGIPVISVTPTTASFDALYIGLQVAETLTVSNSGTDLLSISSITSDNAEFSAESVSLSIAPTKSKRLVVLFAPTGAGVRTGTLSLVSNDPLNPIYTISLQGVGLLPPDISVSPDSLDEHLLTNQTSTRQLTVTNSGGSDLSLVVSQQFVSGPGTSSSATDVTDLQNRMLSNHSSSVGGRDLQSELSASPQQQQSERSVSGNGEAATSSLSSLAGTYSGDYLRFGITDYGEILPFQFPLGNEHLQRGTYLSGYTIAYKVAGQSRLAYSAYDYRSGIVPVSYTEQINTASSLVVQVVTKTSDDVIRFTHTISFDRRDRYVNIQTSITNASAGSVTDMVFKSYADWDVDGVFSGNWDYDLPRNMVYSWSTNYAAIASSRVPDLMDIYGWDDYQTAATDVDYPTGPIIGIDGLELLHFNLGTLSPSADTKIETVFGAGSSLSDLQGAIDRGLRFALWLDVTPENATIPAGLSRQFDVVFDARGLFGGDYLADIMITSNDPDLPELRVPAHLGVTGVPDISLNTGSLDFGSCYMGSSYLDTIIVTNIGTDLLVVTGISSDNADFIPALSTFSLSPNQAMRVAVTFSPSVTGLRSGVLVFASNDPDSPSATVALTGQGITPPDISVSPDSLDESLLTNETSTQTLTITNHQGVDLTWSLDIVPISGPQSVAVTLAIPAVGPNSPSVDQEQPNTNPIALPQRGTPVEATLMDLTGVTILFDLAHSSGGGTYSWSSLVNDLRSRGATVQENYSAVTTAMLESVDIFWITDHYSSWTSSELAALKTWLQGGGGLLIEGDETISSYNTILTTLGAGITYQSQSAATGYTSDILPHPTTAGVDTLYLGYALSRLTPVVAPALVLVRDPFGANNVVCSEVGRGRVVAMADENFIDGVYGFVDNQLFGNQVFDWLAKARNFLSVDIDSGHVAAGNSVNIAVMFDATDLYGGDYLSDILITSNDPDEQVIRIPAHLRVTGVPDISTDPDSLAFGNVFIGTFLSRSIVITNDGTDLLTVTGITAGNGYYAVGPTAFSLEPGASRSVQVIFAPGTEGDLSTTLTISSNDPNEGSLVLPLFGRGVYPPEITIDPASISTTINLGISPTKEFMLEISNVGRSDLQWSNYVGLSKAREIKRYTLTSPTGNNYSQPPNQPNIYPGLRPPMRTSPVSALLGDLTGVRVLIDASHGGDGSSYFSIIIADLQVRGAEVSVNYSSFTPEILQDVDVVWLMWTSWGFNTTEIGALQEFLQRGGGLLCESGQASVFASLLTSLGGGITCWDVWGPSGYTANITSHLTTAGLDSLYLPGGYSLDATSDPAVTLVRDAIGNGRVACSQIGHGRVMVYADAISTDWVIASAAENQLFANQVFDWLANTVRWVSLAPAQGVTAPAETDTVRVTINATDLSDGDYSAVINFESNDPVTPLLVVPVSLHVQEFVCGDVNADGSVTLVDLNQLLDMYFHYGPMPTLPDAGDVNCDGSIGIADIVMVARALWGITPLNCCP